MSTTTDEPRSGGINRRTLVRGAAWTVPVVAVAAAAPAFAASCQQLYAGTLDWGSAAQYTRTSTTAATGKITEANGLVTNVTISSVFSGYAASTTNTDGTANLAVTGTTTGGVGGTAQAGLTFCQTFVNGGTLNNGATSNQTVKFAFDRAVYDVRFTLTDIDSTTNQYLDCIAITFPTNSPGSFTFAAPTSSIVVGAGNVTGTTTGAQVTGNTTGTGPFRSSNANLAQDNTNGAGGNMTVTIPGPITAFQMVYFNRDTGAAAGTGSKQTVFMASMTASVLNSGCLSRG